MKLVKLPLILLIPLSILISCSGDSGGGSGQQREDIPPPTGGTDEDTTGGTSGGTANFDVTLDSELTPAEKTSTQNSIKILESLKIDGSRTEGFSKVFGGNQTSDVVSFLERRVNYIFSEGTDYRTRLVLNSFRLKNNLAYFGMNLSVDIWYTSLINEPDDVRIRINNKNVDITSSRIGVVNLGDIFTQSDAITQAITLVHEARHSDCPEGALVSEIQRWYNGLPPINHTCGQLHGSCPDGSSCDVIPWGPYAVDFIYSISIVNGCSNCSETQRQQAQINANMVQGAAYDINGTMNGVHGPPNMSNSNQIRNDL